MLQIREEGSFTKGRIIVRGKLVTRGKAKRADYILYYKPNIPLALIEAKDNTHSVGDGMQQGLEYADDTRHPFRLLLERRWLRVPRPHRRGRRDRDEPRARRLSLAGRSLGAVSRLEGSDARGRADRPSGLFRRRQRQGPALLPGQRRQRGDRGHRQGPDRILLVMATGTGKTYTAFQIIWRLWKAGRKKRILFLADRNVLIDQTMVNDFRPFGAAMAKLSHQRQDHRARGRHRHRTDHGHRQEAPHRHVLRGLSRPLSGDHRPGGTAEAVPRVLARLLRPDRDRRVPSRQRRRGFRLARNPRILLRRHADRPDRHAEGDEIRLQHRLFRRAGLLLFAEAGHPRRLPRTLQGGQGPYRPRRGRLPAREGPTRPRRRGGRGPHLQHQGLRPHAGAGRPHQAGRHARSPSS